MPIGEKIRALRIERGMSQNDLALACGYTSRASINKIELGKVDPPQSKIQAIAEALDVSPASLIMDDQERERFMDNDSALSSDESQLINGYRSLNPEGKQFLQQSLLLAMNTYSSEKNPGVPDSDGLLG